MSNSPDFIEYLIEQLSALGFIHTKRMFGAHGLYLDERMFGLMADDTLYLKVDEENRATFEAEDLGPFQFQTKNGVSSVMSYYEAPSAALDDVDILLEWSRIGIEAALRAPAPKKRAKAKRK
ncbi:MAG: TfoX/Sxy family protein [Pseudomonadota bacterium]